MGRVSQLQALFANLSYFETENSRKSRRIPSNSLAQVCRLNRECQRKVACQRSNPVYLDNGKVFFRQVFYC